MKLKNIEYVRDMKNRNAKTVGKTLIVHQRDLK